MVKGQSEAGYWFAPSIAGLWLYLAVCFNIKKGFESAVAVHGIYVAVVLTCF